MVIRLGGAGQGKGGRVGARLGRGGRRGEAGFGDRDEASEGVYEGGL